MVWTLFCITVVALLLSMHNILFCLPFLLPIFSILEYAVLVVKNSVGETALPWDELNHVNRLNEHVAKGLVLCHVNCPDFTEDVAFADLLRKHTITEVVVQRFVYK